MQIENFKFFNDFHHIVQIPDAHVCNSTYTHVRKRVVDGFHQELENMAMNSIIETPPKNAVILSSDSYPFKETSKGLCLKDEKGFGQFVGPKFRIDEYMTELDLQLFGNIPWDTLCYEKSYNLLSHPQMPSNIKEQFFDRYEKNRESRFSNFFTHPRNIVARCGAKPLEISVIPVNAFEHIRASGILEQNQEMLDKAMCSFIPWLPSVETKYLTNEKAIEESNRPYDCFLGGIVIPFAYPYRYLAFKKMTELSGNLKILHENRVGLANLYKDAFTAYKNEHITKEQLDLRAHLIGQMQYEEYLERISLSKVAVVCSSVFGFPLKKYFEYMARGCVLVGDVPKYYKEYGFEHMENIVKCDVDDIQDAVMYVLNNEDLRIKLAKNALKLVKERYTPKNQVENIMQHLVLLDRKFNG